MSRIAICTDSTALFAHSAPTVAGVTTVPISVALDGDEYESRDPDDFYTRLADGARATTSTPSPGEFLEAYRAVAASGANEVLSIHLHTQVSATVTSAELAAREAPVPVTVVDSGTVSFGLGVCVAAAADAVSSGASADQAARLVRRLGRSSRNIFVASSADNGRVQGGNGWAVMSFEDGVVTTEAACQSPTEATESMAARIILDGAPRYAAVGYASREVEPWADALAELLASEPGASRVDRYRVTAPVGAHTGPLSFGAFWWPATPRAV
jgi:DegV family protein with EDD domain